MLSEEGLASFNKDNSANFSSAKLSKESIFGEFAKKNLSQDPHKCSHSCPRF